MRDVGIAVWAIFIIVGVIANIVSAARKQQQTAKAPARTFAVPTATSSPPRARVAALPAAPPAQASPPIRRPQPAPVHVAAPPPQPERAERRPGPFFSDAPSLVRAVIAAEVLGKPLALRDE